MARHQRQAPAAAVPFLMRSSLVRSRERKKERKPCRSAADEAKRQFDLRSDLRLTNRDLLGRWRSRPALHSAAGRSVSLALQNCSFLSLFLLTHVASREREIKRERERKRDRSPHRQTDHTVSGCAAPPPLTGADHETSALDANRSSRRDGVCAEGGGSTKRHAHSPVAALVSLLVRCRLP